MSVDPVTDQLLLEATGVAKSYGAVAALRNASLSVRPGEVHALMGANGAGKSTLVKILTGGVRPDGGRILIRGEARDVHSPAEARRAGLVSVYQEPALIPDLDVASNLRLTETPMEPFLSWVRELGVPDLDLRETARNIPLAVLRILDLARALAIEPDVLLLDEMTAALPADLAEKVLDVVRRQARAGRSVIFISHRLLEISALCDRATVLRDGETVGVVDMAPGAEERIVELMLGAPVEKTARPSGATSAASAPSVARQTPAPARPQSARRNQARGRLVRSARRRGARRRRARGPGSGRAVRRAVRIGAAGGRHRGGGGQGGSVRPSRRRHPGGPRLRARRPHRRASDAALGEGEHRPALQRPARAWGPLDKALERKRVDGAIERLQIDTRAQREVQRLSGGNQQKVTIARWIATGARTVLCFDPTRGIDIRTKREIYPLLRELAAQGASVLLYTSELEEVQLVCDRAVVIFGGRVVDIMPAEIADEAR